MKLSYLVRRKAFALYVLLLSFNLQSQSCFTDPQSSCCSNLSMTINPVISATTGNLATVNFTPSVITSTATLDCRTKPSSITYDFGDGSQLQTQPTPYIFNHTYTLTNACTSNTFVVKACINNNEGVFAYTCVKEFTITIPAYSSGISISATPTGCKSYNFSYTGALNNAQWAFGDGLLSPVMANGTNTVSHTYAAGGTYVVTLIPEGFEACPLSFTTVTVADAGPVGYTYTVNNLCDPSAGITLGITSYTNTLSYNWLINGLYVPATGATASYTTNLSVVTNTIILFGTAGNCSSQMSKLISIGTATSALTANTTSLCAGSFLSVYGVNPGAEQYKWNITKPNGVAESPIFGMNPYYMFNTPGTYSISLSTQNTYTVNNAVTTCTAQTPVQQYYISAVPNPSFAFVPMSCNGSMSLTIPTSTFTSYTLNFGNNTSYSGNASSIPFNQTSTTYTTSSVYTVSLTLNNNGCSASYNNNFYVSGVPTLSLICAKPYICPGGNTSISGQLNNVPPLSGIISYAWTGPNAFTANTANINVNTSGVYTLSVTGGVSCPFSYSLTQTITSLAPPTGTLISVAPLSCSSLTTSAVVEISTLLQQQGFYINSVLYPANPSPAGPLQVTVNNLSEGVNYIHIAHFLDESCSGGLGVNVIRNNPALTVNTTNPSGCATNYYGSATATAGAPGGTISWYTPQGYNATALATGGSSGNLSPGTYIAEVVNGYCKTTNYFSITPPSINVSKSGPAGTCPSQSVTINANAAFVPGNVNSQLTYTWYKVTGNTSTQVATGNATSQSLGAGNYILHVSGANSCSTTLSFNILEYSPLSITFNTSLPGCNKPGYTQANVSGGDGNYTYTWYENAVLNPALTGSTYNLNALQSSLTLSLTVNDGSNCSAPSSTLSFNPPQIVTLDNCSGVGTNSATVINGCDISACVQGGTAPYTFEWYKVVTTTSVIQWHFYDNGGQLIASNGTQTVAVAVPSNSTALANDVLALNQNDSLETTVMYPVWDFTSGPAVPKLNSLGTSAMLSATASSTDIAHYYTVTEVVKISNQEVFTAAYTGPSAQAYSNSAFTNGTYKLYVTDAKGCRYPFHIGLLTFPKPSTFPVTFKYVWGMKPVPTTPVKPDNNLQDDMADAAGELSEALDACLQKQTKSLKTALDTTCSSLSQLKDDLQIKFALTEHHYTLYYYDRAGQLTKTVPPEGVELLSTNDINTIKTKRASGTGSTLMVNPHRMLTTYNYNSFGQLLSQNTPDGGSSSFIYDSKNRLRFSQNAKQAIAGVYSYTKYDELGRIREVGESSSNSLGTLNFSTPTATANVAIADNTVHPQTNNKDITTTGYSDITSITYYGKPQRYTQNRVSYTSVDTDPTVSGDEHSTYYSYDSHGNVEWLVQDYPGGIGKNYIAYEYDLVSGKVLQVSYNEKRQDRFYHRYQYDAENRLKGVQTSRDGLMWDNDASYQYYAHGPLKRQVIGEDHVQGLDYIYTIHGWIKSINSPSLSAVSDPGGDNMPGGPMGPGILAHGKTAADKNGMVLNYYNGDYSSNSSNFLTGNNALYSLASYSNTSSPSLYNGNISSWVQSQLNTTTTGPMAPRADLYQYDLLNRIKQSTSMEYNNSSPTGWGAVAGNSVSTASDAFKSTYEYDANGNILTLKRFDQNGTKMDDLSYTYASNQNNKLSQVDDNETVNVLMGRGDMESTHTYGYDAVGNMTVQAGPERLTLNSTPGLYPVTTTIDWTVYGKIRQVKKSITGPSSVTYKEELNFAYDASGNRVKKEFWQDKPQAPATTPNGLKEPNEITSTYYVRDAQGNVMGTYKQYFDITDNNYKIDLVEEAIYGSDRIGQNARKITLQSSPTASAISTPTNGIAVTSEYQNWMTATNKTSTVTTASGMGDLCQCKVVTLNNPVLSGAYNNTTTVTDFLGIANNGVAIAEDLSGNLQFYVVLAKKYLGVNDVCLVYDKTGKLMKGSHSIGQVDPQSKPVIINSPNNSNIYAIVTLDVNKQVKYHLVDMSQTGYAQVGNAGMVTTANVALPVSTGTATAYGFHFTAVENHIDQKVILYASRYTPNVTNTLTGTTDIVAYEFTANSPTPTEYVLHSITGCGSTEEGELQISPNGNKLAWYQHDKSISGFKMRQGYLYTLPLNISKTGVSGPIDIHPISTAGNYGNGALEFMTNSNDLLYSQYGLYTQNSNAATKYDRNIWKYNPLSLNDLTTNPDLINNPAMVTYLLGEIRRGNDGNYYIPNLGETAANNIHSYSGSLWNNGINTAMTSYSYAASWPTQVWKLYDDPSQTLTEFPRYVGAKEYELKDHLGNVKTVISDEKLITDANSDNFAGNTDDYQPRVLNYNDYYAFGAPMPGRKFVSSGEYRFGFNGKENDPETVTQDYGFRIYDNRIAKFLSVDPLTEDFPWYTPYQFAGNKPIISIDLDGAEENIQLEKYWKSQPQLDMTEAPSATSYNIFGIPRNANWHFTQLAKSNPEFFSTRNLNRIKKGLNPTVDAKWIEANPEHAGFKGQTLHSHHVNQGKYGVAIPGKLHSKFHKALHPYRRGKGGIVKNNSVRLNTITNLVSIFFDIKNLIEDKPESRDKFEVGVLTGANSSAAGENLGYIMPFKISKKYDSEGNVESIESTYGVYESYDYDTEQKKYVGVNLLYYVEQRSEFLGGQHQYDAGERTNVETGEKESFLIADDKVKVE